MKVLLVESKYWADLLKIHPCNFVDLQYITNEHKENIFGNLKDFFQRCNKHHMDFGLIPLDQNLSIDDHIPRQ